MVLPSLHGVLLTVTCKYLVIWHIKNKYGHQIKSYTYLWVHVSFKMDFKPKQKTIALGHNFFLSLTQIMIMQERNVCIEYTSLIM